MVWLYSDSFLVASPTHPLKTYIANRDGGTDPLAVTSTIGMVLVWFWSYGCFSFEWGEVNSTQCWFLSLSLTGTFFLALFLRRLLHMLAYALRFTLHSHQQDYPVGLLSVLELQADWFCIFYLVQQEAFSDDVLALQNNLFFSTSE